MADIVLVSVIIGFTALCTAYISWCDRIIGPDPVAADAEAVGALVGPQVTE